MPRVLLCVTDYAILTAFSYYTNLICGKAYNEFRFDTLFFLSAPIFFGFIFLLRKKTYMGICRRLVVIKQG